MRLDGNLNATVEHASNQIWHAQQRLDDPEYMETLVTNLVKDGHGRVRGAALARCQRRARCRAWHRHRYRLDQQVAQGDTWC